MKKVRKIIIPKVKSQLTNKQIRIIVSKMMDDKNNKKVKKSNKHAWDIIKIKGLGK